MHILNIFSLVVCAIQEWSTGRWVGRKFSHKNYFTVYSKLLTGLTNWKDHSDTQVREKGAVRNITTDIQEALLRNARAVTKKAEEAEGPEEEDDMFTLAAFEANAANVGYA
ncbi:hypothetical protein B0H13DRAFT_2305572 [Mycena leptocephala]|nr:hypothetical protein B0H13DRAFT_2305572 [Mycena leptocephala]